MPDENTKSSKKKAGPRFFVAKEVTSNKGRDRNEELSLENNSEETDQKLRKFFSNRALFPRGSQDLKPVKSIVDVEDNLGLAEIEIVRLEEAPSVIRSLEDGASEHPLDRGLMELQEKFKHAARVVDEISSDAEYAMIFASIMADKKVVLPDVKFSRASPTSLPDKAPRLWADRPDDERGMNAAAWIRKVYAPWLGQGLARHHIGELDAALGRAYSSWTRKERHPEDAIADFAEGNPYHRLDDAEALRRRRVGGIASKTRSRAAAKMSHP